MESTQVQFDVMFKLDLMEVFYWGLSNKENSSIIIPTLNSLFFLLNYAKNNLPPNSNDTNIVAVQMTKNGILGLIDNLQYNSNKDVYERCVVLLETFFTVEEDL